MAPRRQQGGTRENNSANVQHKSLALGENNAKLPHRPNLPHNQDLEFRIEVLRVSILIRCQRATLKLLFPALTSQTPAQYPCVEYICDFEWSSSFNNMVQIYPRCDILEPT